jgi:hypothetical protein
MSSRVAEIKVSGATALTSKNKLFIKRIKTKDTTRPSTVPNKTYRIPCLIPRQKEDLCEHRVLRSGIQGGVGLVEKDYAGVPDEPSGEGNLLPLPSRQVRAV